MSVTFLLVVIILLLTSISFTMLAISNTLKESKEKKDSS